MDDFKRRSTRRITAAAIRLVLATTVVTVLALALTTSQAAACAVDDNNYFDSFLDVNCVQSMTNVALDAQGGLRLTTNGTPEATGWDTDTQFDGGITWESVVFPQVGVSSLTRAGTGTGATLGLPATAFPLQRGSSSILSPPASSVDDNDGVEDPSVIKVGATYVMYYSGTGEDGSAPAIFQATSPNGIAWTRANGGAPVLTGTPGAFDEFGVSGPEVHYDALDLSAPYKMWFAGQGPTFGAIGRATSTDGVVWTKQSSGPTPVPVLDHGAPGSADSFAAADPSVIRDGSTWKMWYTGDDTSKKRIAYATSADGITWSKGGKVIAPEDAGVSANLEFGAFAPTVWQTDTGDYKMLLAGRKVVSGDTYQTKILDSSSSDGINWSGPSPAINPSGSSSGFDYSNLDGPDVFVDVGSATPYKAYYAGNTIDANGNFHTRIGHATSTNGNSFGKVGSGPGVNADGSVLDIGTLGTQFDARATSGLSVVLPAGAPAGKKFVGFYGGIRGSDFTWRIGGVTSTDGTSLLRMGDGTQTGGSLLPLGNSPANFDLGGHRDPSALYDAAAGSPHRLYFTAINGSGVKTIGTAATTEDVDKQPVNSGWSTPARILNVGSGFDGSGVSHPSVIKDGATYRMLYTAIDSGGTTSIGYTDSASATSFTGSRTQVLTGGSGFEAGGVKDPVVWINGVGDYRMIYTGVSTENGRTIERLGYATSATGTSWTKASPALILNPSRVPFRYDEYAVSAAGVALDGSVPHVWFSAGDRNARTRAGHAVQSADSTISNGWATYQLGDTTTSVRDIRQITRVSSGTVSLWMSFLQPYSTAGTPYWSDYFPVTVSAGNETLNFLLTIRGIRWQARLSDPSSTPTLDSVSLQHAPVNFNATGGAVTGAVAPPAGLSVANWNTAVINTTLFQPGGTGSGSASVRVLNAVSGAQLAAAGLSTGGNSTLDLSAISTAEHPQLRFAFDLASSGGQATPRVNSLQVSYNKTVAPTLTLAAGAASTIFGTPVTLSGTLTRAGAPLAGRTITIEQQPLGGAAGVAAAVTTDGAGAFSAAVSPDRMTTYTASTAEGGGRPAVSVAVAERVTLTVKRKRGKGYVRGTVGPAHTGKQVVLQQKKGSRWATIKKLKTNSKSAFSFVVKGLKPKGKYQFRATTAADAEHLAGLSPVAYVDAIKMSLAIKRSGRTLTFSGSARPSHPRKAIVIKVLKGTTWTTFAKLKLSARSTFALKKKVAAGNYTFRVDIGGDRDHWPGVSAERKVTVP